jgi:hypothetical protein
MSTNQILALLLRERNKIAKAIDALQGPTKRKGRPPGSGRKAVPPPVEEDSTPRVAVGPTTPVKRKLSAAGRRAIVAATKKRWAAVRAAKAAAGTPASVGATLKAVPTKAPAAAMPKKAPVKAPVPAKKGGLTAAGRKALSIAMKKRWAAKSKATARAKS